MGSWSLAGNALGATPTGFLGTTDNNALVIKTGSPTAERLRVDASGHVGIGTSSPQYPLHIALGKALRIEGGTTATDATDYFSFGGWGTFGIDAPGLVNGRFVVLNSGNVGIGAAQPAASLSLGDLLGVRQLIWDGARNNSNDANCGFGIDLAGTGGSLDIFMSRLYGLNIVAPTGPWPYPSYSAKLTVLPSGNVGIGAPFPIATLDVRGQAAFQGALSLNHAGVTGVGSPGDGRAAITFGATDTPTAFYLGEYDGNAPKASAMLGLYSYQFNDFIQFWAPNGNVGIGTGAPTTKLHVAGDVTVTGDVILTGADCAEQFDAIGSELPEPGAVVVIDESGHLRLSQDPYDKKVAGVVSGAGEYRHALVLDKRESEEGRIPVALVGKVYCKVDADYAPVEVGDLLTTSRTPGHAMKAMDAARVFGSVIGKALRPLAGGKGLIPILIALQ